MLTDSSTQPPAEADAPDSPEVTKTDAQLRLETFYKTWVASPGADSSARGKRLPQAVLRLVARYTPAGDEETFQIMNVLDPVLRTTNSGVVLEAVGCFLRLTRDLPELHAQVYERLKTPLITLMAAGAASQRAR